MDEHASAIDTAAAIRAKEVSPLEVLEATLARIDARDPALNAVIWRNDDEARAEAPSARRPHRRGAPTTSRRSPGCRCPSRTCVPVAGQPVTYGSPAPPTPRPSASELVAAAFVDAGFILCGRTNAPEFGSISVTENVRFGATRNPWDTGYTPGGSSGGAAAAVASGMFPVANASDGGGSIRIPASCCGLVGHKPSRGRVADLVPGLVGAVDRGGRHPHGGRRRRRPRGRSAVPTRWPGGARRAKERPFTEEVGADPGRLRVAVNTVSALGVEVAPECVAAVEHAATLLESLGHHVVRLDADLFDPADLGRLPPPDELGFRPAILDIDPERHGAPQPGLLRRRPGPRQPRTSPTRWPLCSYQSRGILARFDDEFDLLVTPTMAIEPPPVGLLAQVHAQPDFPPMEIVSMAAFTALFNITGPAGGQPARCTSRRRACPWGSSSWPVPSVTPS